MRDSGARRASARRPDPQADRRLSRRPTHGTGLAPSAGAVLAGVLYLLFISGLVAGELFPEFPKNNSTDDATGLARLFGVYSEDPADYAKLLFWSFMSGFSESFVSNIIGRFESKGQDV